MILVVGLALASTLCAAGSTVLKHVSANRPVRTVFGGRLPHLLEQMLGHPLFLMAMVVDAGAVGFQVLALRYGTLSTVQPILTLALVVSLVLNHAVARTRMTRAELGWAATLVVGLVLFLVASGATHPDGGLEAGRRDIGIALAGAALAAMAVGLVATRRARVTVRARTLAAGVAAIYASTAALITSCTRIYGGEGAAELFVSWQLWVLLVVAAAGLVLNQHVFAMAPLHVVLPVIASLDPLFSIVVGRTVFDERLHATPAEVVLEVVGLTLLLLGVIRLSRSKPVLPETVAPGRAPA